MNIKRDIGFAVVGLAILAFAVQRIGWEAVLGVIKVVRIGLPIILAISFVRLTLQTKSWSVALQLDGIRASVRELMFIRLASQGIGYLTILGPAASEPMKISLLRNHPGSSHAASATTATLVDTGVYWFSSGLIGIAGCLSAGVLLAGNRSSMVSMAMLAALFITAMFFMLRPRSPLTALADALGRRCPAWLREGARMDAAVREFASRHPSAVRTMFLLDLTCQALLATEVITILICLKHPLHASTLLGLEAANRMVRILGGWMPARIGTDESGAAAAFVAFGLPATSGLALALTRRTRDLLACLIGLTWLAWRRLSGGNSPAPSARSLPV